MSKEKQPKKRIKVPASEIEQQYRQMFTSYPLPYHGIYTDEDSLEQPSALKYVPSTSTPGVVS